MKDFHYITPDYRGYPGTRVSRQGVSECEAILGKRNVQTEHDKALGRVMMAVLMDDTELFKQFGDTEGFRRWLTDNGDRRRGWQEA